MPPVNDQVDCTQCTFAASKYSTWRGFFHLALPLPCPVLSARSWSKQQKRGLLSQQPLLLGWLSFSSTQVHHPLPLTSCVNPLLSSLLPSTPLASLALAEHPRASCKCSSTDPSGSRQGVLVINLCLWGNLFKLLDVVIHPSIHLHQLC